MRNEVLCFSNDRTDVLTAFKDYFNNYKAVSCGGKGSYDATITFAEKEAKINKRMVEEIKKLAGVSFSENASMEMWASNPMVKWATFAVVNDIIDMVLPETIIESMGLYTEVRNIGMGDSSKFDIKTNDLFSVSKAGRAQRSTEIHKQFEGSVTVTPENHEITVGANLYRVFAGLDSIAEFTMKAIRSMETQVTYDAYSAFDTAMKAQPTTPSGGNLKVSGYSQSELVRLAQTVTAFNAGSKAIVAGTQLALQNVLPTNANYRYSLESDYVKLGYVQNAFGYDALMLPQVADYKTLYKTKLDDKALYVISPSSQKLVKFVFEGGTMTNSMQFYDNANTEGITVLNKSWGTAVATNATFGMIVLA